MKIILLASSAACIAILYHSRPATLRIAKVVLLSQVLNLRHTIPNVEDNVGHAFFNDSIVKSIMTAGNAKLSNGFIMSANFYNEICYVQPHAFINEIKVPIVVFQDTSEEKIDYRLTTDYFSI